MVDQMRVRPLSGEIMTEARPAAFAHDRVPEAMADIVDAEFETVAAASPGARREGRAPDPAPAVSADAFSAAQGGMDVLRGGGAGSVSRRAGPLFWFCGAVVALAAFWVSGGHALGPLLFDRASAQAGASVRLVDVRSKVEDHQGRRFVYVDGAVSNEGAAAVAVQPLTIEVRGDDNSTTRYILHVSEARIEPGERVPFSSRLDAPSGGVAGVMVTIKREGGA
jgi:hypothetical protein